MKDHISRFLFYCVLSSLIPLTLFSQETSLLPVRHYTMEDGLPSNSIRALFHTPDGLMWIGTDAGLCRFDGKSFQTFSSHDGLSGNRIWSIAQDTLGDLWLGTFGKGLCRFNGNCSKSFDTASGLPDNWVRVVHYSSIHNILLAGTQKGIAILKDGVFLPLPHSPVPPGSLGVITSITECRDKIVITSYSHGVFEYFPEKGLIRPHPRFTEAGVRSASGFFVSSSRDTFLGNHRNGIGIIREGETQIEYRDEIGQVFSFSEDEPGNIWLGAWSYEMPNPGGVYRLKGNEPEAMSFRMGIETERIWQVYCDLRNDMVWVATLDQGLFLLLPSFVSHYSSDQLGLQSDEVRSVFTDSRGRRWIGSQEGLMCIHPDGRQERLDRKKLLKLTMDARSGEARKNKEISFDNHIRMWEKNTINFNLIREDPAGRIWVAYDLGLLLVDESLSDIQLFLHPKSQFDFTEDFLLWQGSWNFSGLFETIPDAPEPLRQLPLPPGDPPLGNISQIVRLDGDLWMSTYTDGIFRLHRNKALHYPPSPEIYHNIQCLAMDKEGRLYSGDNTGRIRVYEVSGEKLFLQHEITPKEGIRGTTIRWMEYDPLGWLWAGINMGVHCIHLPSLGTKEPGWIVFLDKEEGLHTQSTSGAHLDKEGKLWLAGGNGIDVIHTHKVYQGWKGQASFYLENVQLDYENLPFSQGPHLLSNGDDRPSLLLPHDLHHLALNIKSINFLNPGKDFFRYRLLGFDEQWSEPGSLERITYNHFGTGSFKLQIEQHNHSALNRPVQQAIRLEVPAPWFHNPGVIALGVLLFLLILSAVFLYILRKAQKQRDKEERIRRRIADLEISSLQSQMNPHFIFNSINAIQSFVLESDTESAILYLSDFSRVIRNALENVNRRLVTLHESLEFLESYLRLEQMRFPDKFTWEIKVEGKLHPAELLVPPFIIQPYAENSIRHGFRHKRDEGHLEVRLEVNTEKKVLEIVLEDNGVGITRSRELDRQLHDQEAYARRNHSGSITQRRIQMMNAPGEQLYGVWISDRKEDGTVSGTRVLIHLPLHHNPQPDAEMQDA